MNKFLRFLNRDPDPAGDKGGGDGDSTVVTVDNKLGTPAPEKYTPPTIDMVKAIPPDYRDKPYFKDVTFENLIKEHVNLQTKLGQRPAGIPNHDAKPEEWDKFFSQFAPKDAKEYEFGETEYSKKYGKDEAFEGKIREIFKKAGVSKHQAAILQKEYDKVLYDTRVQNEQIASQQDEQFDKTLTTLYGDQKDAVLKTVKDLMVQHIPQDMKPLLEKIPNDMLALLTTTLYGVHKKYIAEDNLPGEGQKGTAQDANSLRQKALAIMQTEQYRDFRLPGHEDARKQVSELYQQIAGLEKHKPNTVEV